MPVRFKSALTTSVAEPPNGAMPTETTVLTGTSTCAFAMGAKKPSRTKRRTGQREGDGNFTLMGKFKSDVNIRRTAIRQGLKQVAQAFRRLHRRIVEGRISGGAGEGDVFRENAAILFHMNGHLGIDRRFIDQVGLLPFTHHLFADRGVKSGERIGQARLG